VEAGGKGFCPDCGVVGDLDLDRLGDVGFFGDDPGYAGEFADVGGAEGVFGGGEWDFLVDAEFSESSECDEPGQFGSAK
jgi:hypothetical protein